MLNLYAETLDFATKFNKVLEKVCESRKCAYICNGITNKQQTNIMSTKKYGWNGVGYEENEYNKPIGKTIFILSDDSVDDDDEREGEYYTLEDVLNDREDDYERITYTIFFDTDKAPFAYEMGVVNSKGEMIAHWRAGKNI